MDINIIGHTTDLRTQSKVIYAFISVNNYLRMVGDDFDTFSIQRKQEKHKAYERMKKDIIDGAILPPITLAMKPENVDKTRQFLGENNLHEVANILNESNQVFILDGLQRTHLLNTLKQAGNALETQPNLLIEIWVEKDIKHLIYRLIILNAGRKAMSLRHQVELLFSTIYDEIQKDFEDVTLSREVDKQRRTKPKFYTFENIVTSYYCFLTKNYEPNKENLITQQIQEESVIYANESELNMQFDLFKKYFGLYLKLDEYTFSAYNNNSDNQDFANWWAKENVMNAFFAALADYGNSSTEKQGRILTALNNLIDNFTKEDDVLGLVTFEDIKNRINARKNIGLVTKKLLFDGFREFFLNSGEKPFNDCWITASPS